jgi:SagB-type dehydrogenase family enzyme
MSDKIGSEFMEKTRYEYLAVSDQQQGLPQPPLQIAADQGDVLIALPVPADVQVKAVDLRQAIEGRVSVRRYANRALTLQELSFLLWCTQGVKEVRPDGYCTLRNVPSAGARHALETYLLVNRVDGLKPGLYRFMSIEHKLLEVDLTPDIAGRMTRACLGQGFVKTAAVTLVWIAVVYRMAWRYGQRGYRYLHLDAGHTCQNLYLAAQAVDCGVCAIAAFDDQDLGQTIGVDGQDQFPIYVATVGKMV